VEEKIISKKTIINIPARKQAKQNKIKYTTIEDGVGLTYIHTKKK
jgi:hypothetical protein